VRARVQAPSSDTAAWQSALACHRASDPPAGRAAGQHRRPGPRPGARRRGSADRALAAVASRSDWILQVANPISKVKFDIENFEIEYNFDIEVSNNLNLNSGLLASEVPWLRLDGRVTVPRLPSPGRAVLDPTGTQAGKT
jgi:hypothetical protein